MKIAGDNKNTKAEELVISFLKDKGYVVVFSNDSNFIRFIRNVIVKHLAVQRDCSYASGDENSIYNVIKRQYAKGNRVLLFVESEIHRNPTSNFITQIKKYYPDLLIIVLTPEVNKPILVLLHELGVDNFITKPLTLNTLLEKFANTIRPPSEFSKNIEKGQELLNSGELSKALEIADTLLNEKPNSPAVLMLMGDIYLKMDKKKKAIHCYEQAHASEKLYLEPLKRMAEYYRITGDKKSQMEQLKKLDELSPLNVERKMDLGQLNMEQGKIDDAEAYFNQSVKLTRKQMKDKVANVNLEIAERLMEKHPERAEAYFRNALESKKDILDQEDVHLFNRLGMALRKQKKPAEAIKEYRRALKVSPDDENLYYNIALAFLENKEPATAEAYLKKSMQINPDIYKENHIVAYSIGLIYFYNDKTEQAKHFIEHALQISPDYNPAKQLFTKLQA